MNKEITNSVAHVNSCATMETGDHFKNWVSSKNKKSRRNLIICGMLLLVLWGGMNKAVAQTWNIGDGGGGNTNYLPNVTATLNGNTLTINGSGNMADFWCTGANQYDAGGEAPWWFNPAHRNAIHTIVFQTGSNVQNIGMRAFKECSNLQTIIIPSSVTKINGQAFYGCSSLHTVELVNGSSPLQFVGYQVSNPCTGTNINTYDWFDGCTSPLTLYLGREINNWGTSSANQPFYHLKNTLTTLIIGETVNEIGVEAFKDCESLKTVDIKEKCTGTLNFVKYYFGDGGHFQNCKIETLYLRRHLATGDSYSNGTPFAGNTWLKSVTIGDCVETIYNNSFKDCKNLEILTLGSALITIGSSAFEGCNKLLALNLPQEVTTIGSSAFKGCSILPSLTIPTSVNEIGVEAFKDCESLKTVDIKEKCTGTLNFVKYYFDDGGHFQNCKIETLYLRRHLATGDYSNGTPFAGNTWLKSVTIGDCVTTINNNSFNNCTNITTITSLSCPSPAIGDNTFNGVSKSIPVYVKCACITTYQTPPWGEFTNFQTIDGSVPSQPDIITGAITVCAGGSAQSYSISAVSGATSYTWSLPSDWSGSSTSTSISATPSLNAQSGNISVTANNSCGNSPARTLNVTVNIPPSAPTDINGVSIINLGESATLTASGGNEGSGCTYQWGTESCGSNIISSQTGISITVSPTATTTYWVRRVGNSPCNETTTACATKSITVNLGINESISNQLHIYPNPTTGELRIESGKLRVESIEIFDVYGRNVLMSLETTLNIAHLSAGVYFVKIHTEKGEVMKKVLKE